MSAALADQLPLPRHLAWEITDGSGHVVRPLGRDAEGLLLYAADGWMAVQIVAAERPRLGTADPLGGSEQQRAAAYSTCLAYSGRYEIRGDTILHSVEVSLFPDWTAPSRCGCTSWTETG